ncbi:MAG: hypothetical protein HZA48_08595 [Planctomycetes bacterium]|nr:hypothetical protein [Planctomycetota bacterium]
MAKRKICILFSLACTVLLLAGGKDFSAEYKEKAASFNKKNAEEFVKIADWCKTNGLADEATDCWNKALGYDPDNKTAKKGLGEPAPAAPAPEKLEELKKQYADKAEKIKEKLADNSFNLGKWLAQKKKIDLARAEYKKTIEIFPDHAGARKELGQKKYEDQWLTDDEIKTKQGLKKFQGKWVKAEEYDKSVAKLLDDTKKSFQGQYGLYFKMEYIPGYIMAFDTSDAKAKEIVNYMIDFHKMTYNTYFEKEIETPFNLICFKTKRDYSSKSGADPQSEGMFIPPNNLYTYSETGVGTVFHEMVHGYLSLNFGGRLPQWFDEGFASYFEQPLVDFNSGKLLQIEYKNWRLPALTGAISSNSYIPLDKFIKSDGAGSQLQLAEARYLICYLHKKGVLTDLIKSFMATPKNINDVKAYEDALGMKIGDIEKDFITFVKGL